MALQAQQRQLLLLANNNNNKEIKTQTWNAKTTLPSPPQRSRSTNNFKKERKPISQLSPLYKSVRRTKTNFTTANITLKKKGKVKAKKTISKKKYKNIVNEKQQQQKMKNITHRNKSNENIATNNKFILSNKVRKQNAFLPSKNITNKAFRSDSLQMQIEFQEKLRKLKEQAKHDRFGIQEQNLPQNINRTGFYSKIFALHEEYFEKICENDLSYGQLLKQIKNEYDKQFRLAGKTDHGYQIVQSCQEELKNVNEMLINEKTGKKLLKEEITRIKEMLELQKQANQTKTPPLSLNKSIPKQRLQQREQTYNGSPIPSPLKNKLKTPTSQIKKYSNEIVSSISTGSLRSENKYTGGGSSSIINSSLTTKNIDGISLTEVKELKEEVKLLRMVLSEQNPKAYKEIFGSGSISIVNSSTRSFDIETPEHDASAYTSNPNDNNSSTHRSEGNSSGRLLHTPPHSDATNEGIYDENKNNYSNNLSQERLKLHHRFTSNTLGSYNNSWESIGELEGSRLGSSNISSSGKYKGTPLRNIPEGQSVASHGNLLPLTNIPEEEYLSETSRSVMTDRSTRSVLSDASSMALSPRLSFGKDLTRPPDVPSLELNQLANLKSEISESDDQEST